MKVDEIRKALDAYKPQRGILRIEYIDDICVKTETLNFKTK